MGQLNTTAILTDAILKQNDKGLAFQLWVANNGTRTEVTRTQYDAPLDAAIEAKFANGQQENLRMRVASVMHYATYPVSALAYQSANHYSYDIHGNVKEMLQDAPALAPGGLQYRSTQYDYELISGNMKKVSYQKEKIDQLTHEYKYDDLNRLTDVLSSIDDLHYHREASYNYFDYGPLARKEIGSARVQGQDFTYTLNGWLKGMNSNTLDKTKDPGKDGSVYPSGVFAARNERVAKDVVGFSLGYYGGDYSPIGGNPAEAAYAGTAFGNGADDLFNGNIRHMVTAIEGLAIQGYAYRYDQLQRIKHMQVYRASDVQSLFAWTNSSATDEYKTTFSYDRNGNLLSLNRNGIGTELDMDRFVYNYHTLGGQPSNRLSYVEDGGTDYGSYEDIKSGQTTGNYTYNKIGELIEDVSEDMELVWRTGDHKLSKIIRNDQDSPQIEFHYNPFGQRSMKVEKPRSGGSILNPSNWKYTYYVYDANGQVMAVYSGNFQGSSEQVKLSEQHLYGSERLGMMTRNVVMFDNGVTSYTHKEEDVVHEDERGYKRYELLGHTNSVLAVISDRKMYNSVDGNYEPVLISWADYYAFGMLQSGRHGSATSELYRYQFQSMETDRGISGNGNSYTTEFRQYDPRLGRWKSLDPLMAKFPHSSPYVAFANNPVYFTDPYGLEPVNDGGDGGDDKKSDGGGEDGGGKIYQGGTANETEYTYKRSTWQKIVAPIKRLGRNIDNFIAKRKEMKENYMHSREAYLDHRYGDKQPDKAGDFERLYRQYHWGKYDGNFVRLSSNQHQRLMQQWNIEAWNHTVSLLNKFGILSVSAAGGVALLGTGGVSFTSSTLSGHIGNGLRFYHTNFGMRGGYFNMGLNYANQSYVTGNWGLEGKSISSLVLSGGLPYNATFGGQMLINMSDPWVNVSYGNNKFGFGGFVVDRDFSNAVILTTFGAFGPLYSTVPLFRSPLLNFIIETILLSPVEKALTEESE